MLKISSLFKIITFAACILVALGHPSINIGSTGNYSVHPPASGSTGK
jgi:hypothetical protein